MNHDWQNGVVERVVDGARAGSHRGTSRAGAAWARVGGSGPAAHWSCAIGGERFFVKTADVASVTAIEGEADGLAALARCGAIRVPEVVAHGVSSGVAFVVLEWLELANGGRDAALANALARQHRQRGERFGWHRDNTIGATPQPNPPSDGWATFFRDARLAPQLALAARNGLPPPMLDAGDRLLAEVPALLRGHEPVPSLLHGDLWAGNAGRLVTGEPVVFDPAVYCGDREADIAMTELFGGFDRDFYRAYRGAWPLDDGYEKRRVLYNLYHVLNHANLFGGGYVRQAGSTIEALLANRR
jgi:fructosamine-3-kinase